MVARLRIKKLTSLTISTCPFAYTVTQYKDNMNNLEKDMFFGFSSQELSTMGRIAKEISGEWNGDESGIQEERAHIANDILKKIDELQELLKEMSELN